MSGDKRRVVIVDAAPSITESLKMIFEARYWPGGGVSLIDLNLHHGEEFLHPNGGSLPKRQNNPRI